MSMPLVGAMLVGAMASSLFNKGGQSSYNYSSAPIQYQQSTAVPTVPKAPEALDQGEDNAAATAMKEAEEKEKQAALARQKGGQDVFTSPLGVIGQANVNRKQLLGA